MKHLKTILVLALILSNININAQFFKQTIKGNKEFEDYTRILGKFDQVSVAGAFEVTLIQSDQAKLEIAVESNLEQYLLTEVKDRKLKIRWQNKIQARPSKTVKINVYYNMDLEKISLAGSGSIKGKQMLESEQLSLNLAGSGNIKLGLHVLSLACDMAGSGNVILEGETQEFDCSKAGSGDLNSEELWCKVLHLESAGSGNANVHVSDELIASLAGSGNIIYKGNPKVNKVKVAGSGIVKMK